MAEVAYTSRVHIERVRGNDHLLRRAAPAVAEPEQIERPVQGARVLVVAHAEFELLTREITVVGVRRREVREDARPVDALPPEGVVLGRVGVVPGQFLGQEVVAARLFDQLRQVARVAEHVGQPKDPRLITELVHEEALAVQQLADERLP